MIRRVLEALRERGLDIQSPHRLNATNRMRVLQRVHRGREVRTVIDCGAHRGVVTRAFRRMFPRAEIYAFEPTPDTFARLRQNTGGMPGVHLVNAAVGAERGELNLYLVEGWEQSNSLVRPSEGAACVRVPVVALGEFCGERGISHVDVLKMDVEGYELQALRGMEEMLRTQEVDAILAEVRFEPNAPGCTYFVELAGYLRDFGYRLLGFYSTIYHPWLQADWCDMILVSDRALARMKGEPPVEAPRAETISA